MNQGDPAPLVCIGCGCSDRNACTDERGAQRCSWLVVGGEVRVSRGIRHRPGLCSHCKTDHAARWNKPDWDLSEAAAERARLGLATTNSGKLREIQHCRSCGARIYWVSTAKGKNMPVEADSVGPDDFTYDHKRHVSHFSTCPRAGQHRRRRA